MTNIKFQASKAIAEHYRRDHGIATDNDILLAHHLWEKGLLVPDLPEPVDNFNEYMGTWEANGIAIPAGPNVVKLTPVGYMSPAEARALALALLAAANHAEGGKK